MNPPPNPPLNPLFDQFIVEARELLAMANSSLLRLERDGTDKAAVNDLFRALHTLKGATGLFDMPAFTRLVHAGEDALTALRGGRLVLSPELADLLFQLLDQCARWVDRLEAEGAMPADAGAASHRLEGALRAHLGGEASPSGGAGAPADGLFAWIDGLTDAEHQAVAAAEEGNATRWMVATWT